MKEKLYRFMQGRYGTDRLNQWILGFALLFILLSYFISSYLIFVGYALWGFAIYRMFSKQIYKRYNENMAFNHFMRGYDRYKNYLRRKFKDQYNAYYLCPSCKQMVRVPKGQGKITITCPKCGTRFNKRT